MKRLRVAIVDDEALSRRAMRQLLDARDDVEVIAECADAMNPTAFDGADVVFLDVLMPGRSGLDLARHLPRVGPPFVVFVTAYDEYAVPAFETEAIDYLPKPVAAERLTKTIARVRERLNAKPDVGAPGQLLTRVGERDVVIPFPDIDCLEADGVYAAVTVGERRYLVRSSLDALERTLSPAAFVRVHRSWIVPRDRIVSVRRSKGAHREIVLRSGAVVPISRRRQSLVMKLLRGSRLSH
jgi:DNA-binding LytR/AlgR family response regulator